MRNEGDQFFVLLTQKVLNAIDSGDYRTYRELCDDKMICFEPESKGHLVEGLPFHHHYFDLSAHNADQSKLAKVQSTIVNPHVIHTAEMAIVAYVRLVQRGFETASHPETRVWQLAQGRSEDNRIWKLVHLHRS